MSLIRCKLPAIYLVLCISTTFLCPLQSFQSCQNLGLSMQTRFALIISRYAYAVWQLKCHKTNWLPWQKAQADKHKRERGETESEGGGRVGCVDVDVSVDGNNKDLYGKESHRNACLIKLHSPSSQLITSWYIHINTKHFGLGFDVRVIHGEKLL